MSRLFALSLVLVGAMSCATSRYRYAPVMLTSAELDGKPAIEAAIPPEDPHGAIRIVPLGIATVTPPADSEQAGFVAFYVRLSIENKSPEIWTLDEAAQVLVTKWRGEDFASYATTPTGVRAPIVAIEPGRSLRVDLLFELPPGATKPEHIEVFDVRWSMKAGTRDVSGTAAFQRLSVDPRQQREVLETIPPPQRGPGRYGPRPER